MFLCIPAGLSKLVYINSFTSFFYIFIAIHMTDMISYSFLLYNPKGKPLLNAYTTDSFTHSFKLLIKTLTHTGLGAENRTVIKKNNSCLHDLSMYPGLQRLGQDYILFKRLTFWCDKCLPSFKVPEKHLLGGLQIKLNSYRSGVWQTKYKGSLRV